MHSSHISSKSMNHITKTADSKMDTGNTSHYFTDQEWLAIRRSQMDIPDNCIFPAREHKSVRHYLVAIFMVASTLIKLPVR